MKATRGVRIPELAIGSAIVLSCVVGALLWNGSATSAAERVLVAAHDLERGHVLTLDDLATVEVTARDEIALLPSSLGDDVVGLRVTTDLVAGAPFTESQLASRRPLDASDGLVGVVVSADQAPTELASGDLVQVVTVSHEADGSVETSRLPMTIEVWDVTTPDEMTGDRGVTLRVAVDAAVDVVGHDEIHLVKVGG